MSEATRELPLFPLNVVLFPGGPLPLRIFETRYIDMVRRCLRTDTGFGVVLLLEGREVGGAARTAGVGTEARIVDFNRLEDGLLGLTCLGQAKLRIVRAWRQPDGLNLGEVVELPPEPVLPLPEDCAHLAEALRRVLPDLGASFEKLSPRLDDASWVGSRLAELLPLQPLEKQALLELQDPVDRLRVLAPLVRRMSN